MSPLPEIPQCRFHIIELSVSYHLLSPKKPQAPSVLWKRTPVPSGISQGRHIQTIIETRHALFLLWCLQICLGCSGGKDGSTEPTVIAPAITSQPQSATVDLGASVTFSVEATGSGPFSFQWRKNATPISGATTNAYTISGISASDDGAEFSVAVSNSAGSVISNAARLTVRITPSITTQPIDIAILSGISATFSVVATPSSATFQWRRNGTMIPGATGASYAVGVPLAGDNGAAYSVSVTNQYGSVESRNAALTVAQSNVVRPTSYANAKAFDTGPTSVPGWGNARVFGDFFGAGNRDYFVATLNYDPGKPISEASPGEFRFWRRSGSTWIAESGVIDNSVGCIHPRKAVVADFNEDHRPDVFIACHGYDAPPFPGELNRVLVSQPDGTYQNRAVAGPPGFYHSVTAFDVNNDGRVDVVTTNNFASKALQVYLNDGSGNFTQRLDLSPALSGAYYTVDAVDVDNDGRLDLLAAGHEWENGKPVVFINTGTGSFASTSPRTLPPVPNDGVILDFIVFDADRNGVNEIYTLRTSGGDGTFYTSRTLQRILWPNLESTVLSAERPAQWIDFLFPVFLGGRYRLSSDNTTVAFSIDLP